ncbi:hypothetical protein MNV49_003202 [Pseudohyphozyma bogoriensis]|nr:hypothetical protein MNV49_003202 [Pseudohyphozyma bogoriensis]
MAVTRKHQPHGWALPALYFAALLAVTNGASTLPSQCTVSGTTAVCTYTATDSGVVNALTLPASATSVDITVNGAQGGGGASGGTISNTFTNLASSELYVLVGGVGSSPTQSDPINVGCPTTGGGGGGATDVRTSPSDLNSRIIVAGAHAFPLLIPDSKDPVADYGAGGGGGGGGIYGGSGGAGWTSITSNQPIPLTSGGYLGDAGDMASGSGAGGSSTSGATATTSTNAMAGALIIVNAATAATASNYDCEFDSQDGYSLCLFSRVGEINSLQVPSDATSVTIQLVGGNGASTANARYGGYGYNGGGNGGTGLENGGATDVRTVAPSDALTSATDQASLNSRILVAAGGGGTAGDASYDPGQCGWGAAADEDGSLATPNCGSYDGAPSGAAPAYPYGLAGDGTFGVGGNGGGAAASSPNNGGGGGGGGYWGGGGGQGSAIIENDGVYPWAGGGGGSNWYIGVEDVLNRKRAGSTTLDPAGAVITFEYVDDAAPTAAEKKRTGVDCLALPGVQGVQCSEDRCVSYSCVAPYKLRNGKCVKVNYTYDLSSKTCVTGCGDGYYEWTYATWDINSQTSGYCDRCPVKSAGVNCGQACGPGRYWRSGMLNFTYSSGTNNGACETCPDGTTSLAGSIDASDCTACPAGSAGSNGACNVCPAGSFAEGTGNAACQTCPDGTTSVENSTGVSACTPCPLGTAGTAGACNVCFPGREPPEAGAASCLPCPAGAGASPSYGQCETCRVGFVLAVS